MGDNDLLAHILGITKLFRPTIKSGHECLHDDIKCLACGQIVHLSACKLTDWRWYYYEETLTKIIHQQCSCQGNAQATVPIDTQNEKKH